jgi:hypothetical protein
MRQTKGKRKSDYEDPPSSKALRRASEDEDDQDQDQGKLRR